MTVGGTWGKILHIDLGSGEKWIENPPDEIYLKLLGGRALAAYLLLRDLPPGTDALSPDNLLIFAPGVLQGTNLPGSGRHGVAAKSPLTGTIASSEVGGWWGHEFKRAGFDALVVHGRAEAPVYLWIKNGEIEIRDAAHIWGMDTADVEQVIRAELDDKMSIAQIGAAGENQVLYAAVMHDINRAAGRGGLGAVMGSKNLKAIAARGTMRLPVAERKRINAVAKWLGDNYQEKAAWAVKIGTVQGVLNWGRLGALPTYNFREPIFETREQISGQLMHETILLERDTCQVCPITCKQVVEYDGQEYPESPYLRSDFFHKIKIDKAYGGPEYETLGAFGSACGVDDLLAVAKAHELSSRWGMDTISLGMTIAFVMECVEQGLLDAEQTGDFLPQWGDAQALLDAIEMIAFRRGFGDKMALGSRKLAEWIGNGAEAFTVEVKGQELPMHEPRLKQSLAIGYATAPVGADHQMNMHDTAYTRPGESLERVAAVQTFEPMAVNDLGEQKMQLFYHEVNFKHAFDCALICHFHPYDYNHLAEALSGATGYDYDARSALAVGERAQTLCRLFNLREGFTAEDDKLPRRVMKAFKEGPLAGVEITDEVFFTARNYWYGLMGWTQEGVPTQERLQALGLAELLDGISITVAA
ncbi:MAG: aldehyde ferredoxin oxidoreductase family protein [Caldilineales bacterium]|nr:aldehyde ferredoxin oxidoreductase family protein [Caldilineales bacterium]